MYLVCGNYLFIDLFLTVLGAPIVICAFPACSEDLIDIYQISRWISLLSPLSLTRARVFVLFCVCLGQVAENNPHDTLTPWSEGSETTQGSCIPNERLTFLSLALP